ncbi:hypothetical protein ES703_14947 [subsurface metagenome]
MSDEPDGWDWAKWLSELGMGLGGGLSLHHKLAYGRWGDEKLDCHGKIGAGLFFVSSLIRLGCEILEPPRCPHCRSRLTHVPQYQRYYCENCLEYV